MSRVSGNQLSSLNRWDTRLLSIATTAVLALPEIRWPAPCGAACLADTELPCVSQVGQWIDSAPQHLKPLVFFKGIDERYALLNTAAHK